MTINGNTATQTETAGTTTYAWDRRDRLTSVTLPDTNVVSFAYDPFGRRVRRITPSGTTIYIYDGAHIIAELDASGNVVARYTQGPRIDEPLAMLRGGQTYFYQADGLGSVTVLTDSAAGTAATYDYQAFGGFASTSGSVLNPFRFTGREWDGGLGLHYYRARYHDPLQGRFISEDPIRDGINFFAYVSNRPLDLGDPSGLCKVEMLYSPVSFLGFTIAYHAFLVVSNNTGGPPKPLFYRAGPGEGGVLEAIGGVPYIADRINPDWDPSAISQTLLDDDSDCRCVTEKLNEYTNRVNRARIRYRPFSTNSNAYAAGATQAAGVPVPRPPVQVPGFNTPLPVEPQK